MLISAIPCLRDIFAEFTISSTSIIITVTHTRLDCCSLWRLAFTLRRHATLACLPSPLKSRITNRQGRIGCLVSPTSSMQRARVMRKSALKPQVWGLLTLAPISPTHYVIGNVYMCVPLVRTSALKVEYSPLQPVWRQNLGGGLLTLPNPQYTRSVIRSASTRPIKGKA